MNDPRVADDVLMDLAVARGNLRQIWRSVEELRGCARSAGAGLLAEISLLDLDIGADLGRGAGGQQLAIDQHRG